MLRSELCGCGVNVQIGGGRASWAACGGHRCNKPTPSAFIGGVGLVQPAAVITSCLCVGCRVSLLFYLWACVSWLVADASFSSVSFVRTYTRFCSACSTVPQRYVHARAPWRCGTVRTPMQSGLVQCIAPGYTHPFFTITGTKEVAEAPCCVAGDRQSRSTGTCPSH